VDCLTVKKKAIRCFKASVNIYQSRRRNALEDLKLLLSLLLFEFVFCQNMLGLLMQIPYTLNLSDVPHCCASSPCCHLLAYNVLFTVWSCLWSTFMYCLLLLVTKPFMLQDVCVAAILLSYLVHKNISVPKFTHFF
jgi:hypothetical protein